MEKAIVGIGVKLNRDSALDLTEKTEIKAILRFSFFRKATGMLQS